MRLPQPPPILAVTAALLFLSPRFAHAAVCDTETADPIFPEQDFWEARMLLCNATTTCPDMPGGACSVTSRLSTTGLYAWALRKGGVSPPVESKDGWITSFPRCFDATQEIIGECFVKRNRTGGVMDWGGERYELRMYDEARDAYSDTAVSSFPVSGAPSPTVSPTNTPREPVSDGDDDTGGGLSKGAIAGIAIGAAVGVFLLIAAGMWVYRNKQLNHRAAVELAAQGDPYYGPGGAGEVKGYDAGDPEKPSPWLGGDGGGGPVQHEMTPYEMGRKSEAVEMPVDREIEEMAGGRQTVYADPWKGREWDGGRS